MSTDGELFGMLLVLFVFEMVALAIHALLGRALLGPRFGTDANPVKKWKIVFLGGLSYILALGLILVIAHLLPHDLNLPIQLYSG